MTKRELIADIKAERERLEAVLARIKPEEMTVPGVTGDWSVKDTLAHLAVWVSRTVTAIFQAERGQKPVLGVPNDHNSDWANVNKRDYDEQKSRPLERILTDFRGSHAQLIKRLEQWPDEATLFDKNRYPSLDGESLASLAHGNGDEHDAEHRVQIEAWLDSVA